MRLPCKFCGRRLKSWEFLANHVAYWHEAEYVALQVKLDAHEAVRRVNEGV